MWLQGCATDSGESANTTCAEWLEIADPPELDGDPLSEGQREILTATLSHLDLGPGERNVAIGALQIAQFCGVDNSTGKRKNSNRPISDGIRSE